MTRRQPDIAALVVAAIIPVAAGDRGFNFTVDRTDRRNPRPEAAAGGRLGANFRSKVSCTAALPGPYALVVCNLLNAVSGAIFGVMMMVVAADLTRRTGGFNLVLGALGVAVSVGASLSPLFTGDACGRVRCPLRLHESGLAGLECPWRERVISVVSGSSHEF